MALPLLALRCRHCDHHAQALPGARCPTDGHFLVASTADPLVGRELAPDLVLFDVLSDGGGFSRVYRAVQLRLAREVVVKVLRPQQAEVALGRARFLQEARLLAELGDEPRVVTVHDCGELGDLLYLVLARAPGEPLSVRLKHGPLPEAQAVALVGEVLLALTSVHARGQVHRDLKPDNIIVHDLGRPQVTLIDFGIAKLLNSNEDSPRTATDVSLGTPRSMAPEQLQSGGEVGPWTDVYAVGVLLFELLTGHPPFEGSAAELVGAHLYQPPPELPGRYGPLVERALAKRPADRFADAAAMARALAAVGEVGVEASKIIALSPTLDAVEKVRGPRWRAERVTKERATATGWRSQRSTRTLRVAAAVGAAALLAVVAVLWPGGQPVGDALARLEPANFAAGQGGPANITAERGPGPAEGAGQAAAALAGKVAAANPLNITADRSRAPATVMGRPGLPADVTVEGAGAATLPADITAIPPAPVTAPPAPATTALPMAAPATNAPAPATAAPETGAPAPATAVKVPASPARVPGQPAKATAAPATAAPAARAPAPATAPPAKAPAAVKPARVAGQPPSAAPPTAAPAAPPTAAPPTGAPTAAPPTATPRASPALIRRLREAVRTCACDRARALLAEAAQTTDHAALQTEVDRCRPKLPGLACRYEGP